MFGLFGTSKQDILQEGRQAMATLEAHDSRGRLDADDPVDRPPIDVVVPQRHLERCDGGSAGGLRGRHDK